MGDCECENGIGSVVEHLFEIRKHIKRQTEWHDSIRMEKSQQYAIPASNILDDFRIFAPENYYIWDITRITAQGFSSGSVQIQIANTGEVIDTISTAGSKFYNPGGEPFVTGRQDRLVFVSVSAANAVVSIGYNKIPFDAIGQYLLS